MFAFFLGILAGIVAVVLIGVGVARFVPQPGDGRDNRAD